MLQGCRAPAITQSSSPLADALPPRTGNRRWTQKTTSPAPSSPANHSARDVRVGASRSPSTHVRFGLPVPVLLPPPPAAARNEDAGEPRESQNPQSDHLFLPKGRRAPLQMFVVRMAAAAGGISRRGSQACSALVFAKTVRRGYRPVNPVDTCHLSRTWRDWLIGALSRCVVADEKFSADLPQR